MYWLFYLLLPATKSTGHIREASDVQCDLCVWGWGGHLVLKTIQKMCGAYGRNVSPNRVELLKPAHEALTLTELWCEIKPGRYIKASRCSNVPLSLCSGSYWSWQLWNKLRMPCSRKILWAYEHWGWRDCAIRLCALIRGWIRWFPPGLEVCAVVTRGVNCQIEIHATAIILTCQIEMKTFYWITVCKLNKCAYERCRVNPFDWSAGLTGPIAPSHQSKQCGSGTHLHAHSFGFKLAIWFGEGPPLFTPSDILEKEEALSLFIHTDTVQSRWNGEKGQTKSLMSLININSVRNKGTCNVQFFTHAKRHLGIDSGPIIHTLNYAMSLMKIQKVQLYHHRLRSLIQGGSA